MVTTRLRAREARNINAMLPDAVLLQIFDQLGSVKRAACALTCKRWLEVLASVRFELKIKTSITSSQLARLATRFSAVTDIDLSGLSSGVWGDPRWCNCNVVSDSITDATLNVIAHEYGPTLLRLDCSGCKRITDNGLASIASSCSSLRTLKLANCTGIGNKRGLCSIALSCSELRVLNISYCKQVDDRILRAIAKLPRLEELDLSNCCKVTEHGLRLLAEGCPKTQLKSFRFTHSHCTADAGLLAIAQNCSSLQALVLDKCRAVTDNVLMAVANNCPALRHLSLAWCIRFNTLDYRPCTFTPQGLQAIADHCRLLEALVLDMCLGVDDSSLIRMVQNCPKLRQLGLRYLPVTDASLVAIGKYAPNLEFLDVAGNGGTEAMVGSMMSDQRVGRTGLVALAKGCHRLQTLILDTCPGVDNEALAAIAENCPELQHLSLNDSGRRLNGLGMQAIFKGCRKLKRLEVRRCREVVAWGEGCKWGPKPDGCVVEYFSVAWWPDSRYHYY